MQKLSVELKNIEMSVGSKQVLEVSHLSIHQWDRIGIVGGNGQGKTTLLKLLGGCYQPDQGEVTINESFAVFHQGTRAREVHADYQLLSKLNVPKSSAETFSGGEETRMKLAQVFSEYHEGLLLDEPTTHLDREGIDFLIEELSYYYGTLVIVSHDRYFLDQTVTKIWEVADGTVGEYQGNYTAYQQQKEAQAQFSLNEQAIYLKEKKRLEQAMLEKQAKAKKMRQVSDKQRNRHIKPSRLSGSKQKDTAVKGVQQAAKNIEKRLSQLTTGPVVIPRKPIEFQQPNHIRLHNKYPIMGERVSLTRGQKVLLKDTDFQFPLGAVIALQGPNGCGKSSLLSHILNRGEGISVSPKVVFGTFDQASHQLSEAETLVGYLLKGSDYQESMVRAVLSNLGFSATDGSKQVNELSGGEKNRLVLGRLFLEEANILLLDEPTNFIGLNSRLALEHFINSYSGTILLTSHDRYFVERVATQIWHFQNQTLRLE